MEDEIVEKMLECPFTWDIDDEVVQTHQISESDKDALDFYLPYLSVIKTMTKIYVYAMTERLSEAEYCAESAQKLWNAINKEDLEREGISVPMTEHILQSTIYHYLCIKSEFPEAGDEARRLLLLTELCDARGVLSHAKPRATLSGVKSVVWSTFQDDEAMARAEQLARRAIELAPRVPLWHFGLGLCIRRQRLKDKIRHPPDAEIDAFTMAYDLAANLMYGIHLAQMYLDNEQIDMARMVYLEIHDQKPESVRIRLRLALGLLRLKEYEKAKETLDYVAEKTPNSVLYLHCMGLYHQRFENHVVAADFFKRAARFGNMASILKQAECLNQGLPGFNVALCLLESLDEFQTATTSRQVLLIQIGLAYYCQNRSAAQALDYLSEAIDINPMNPQLRRCTNVTNAKPCNVLNLIIDEVIPEYRKLKRAARSNFSFEDLDNLEAICRNIIDNAEEVEDDVDVNMSISIFNESH